jgi:3-methyladenine DNA glycosylase AlkD
MSDYINKLRILLEKYANPHKGEMMAQYLKDKVKFLGISAPDRKKLFKLFFNTFPIPSYSDSKILAKELFVLPEREFGYFAIELLAKHKKKWIPTDIVFFETLLLTRPWWDTTDVLNAKILSVFFKKYPNLAPSITDAWSKSDDIWLKRVSIIFQLSYKQNTDLELLERHILENAENNDLFIQKAIGWALREYSKTDYRWVLNFVIQNSTKLKASSKREAIKWIDDNGLIY